MSGSTAITKLDAPPTPSVISLITLIPFTLTTRPSGAISRSRVGNVDWVWSMWVDEFALVMLMTMWTSEKVRLTSATPFESTEFTVTASLAVMSILTGAETVPMSVEKVRGCVQGVVVGRALRVCQRQGLRVRNDRAARDCCESDRGQPPHVSDATRQTSDLVVLCGGFGGALGRLVCRLGGGGLQPGDRHDLAEAAQRGFPIRQ